MAFDFTIIDFSIFVTNPFTSWEKYMLQHQNTEHKSGNPESGKVSVYYNKVNRAKD